MNGYVVHREYVSVALTRHDTLWPEEGRRLGDHRKGVVVIVYGDLRSPLRWNRHGRRRVRPKGKVPAVAGRRDTERVRNKREYS